MGSDMPTLVQNLSVLNGARLCSQRGASRRPLGEAHVHRRQVLTIPRQDVMDFAALSHSESVA